jgi:hypothetical protein
MTAIRPFYDKGIDSTHNMGFNSRMALTESSFSNFVMESHFIRLFRARIRAEDLDSNAGRRASTASVDRSCKPPPFKHLHFILHQPCGGFNTVAEFSKDSVTPVPEHVTDVNRM